MNPHAVPQSSTEQSARLIDIATRNVICLRSGDSVREAANIMAEKRISSLVVTDEGGHPAGIVTERNILQAMQSGCPAETALRHVMSAPVITVPESISCLEAYQLCLRDGIRHLVIVDAAQRLVGVISETDFRLHLNLTALAGRRKIASIARRAAIALPASASLDQALDLMLAQHKSCAVVVKDNKPVGIITERDVVRFYSGGESCAGITLGQAMVAPVLTLPLDAPTSQAAEIMLARKVRHLIVVDEDGCMAGLVSEHELTQAMAIGMAEERGGVEEYFLHALVNTMPDLVWLKDVDGVYLACNARFEHFFGAQERHIVGKTDYDFVSKEQGDFFREHDRLAMDRDGPSVNEEWVTFANDGHRELLETIKTPMRDSRGRLIGVLGIARDITRRRELEGKLEESEKKFHDIFESVGDCIEIISADGRILDMNHTGYERQGYTREEMVGRKLSEFAAPGNEGRVAERMALIKSQGYATFESERLRKDGTIIPLEVRSRLIEIDGQPVFLGISRDISARKQAEAALHASEEKLRGLYELSPMGIALTDMQGHYLEFNDAFRRICGYTREELNQLDYWALTPKEYADKEAEQLESLNTKGYYGPYEKEYIRKDGSRIPLRLNGVLIRDNTGKSYIWSIVEDITERKRAEAALRENEERLALATLHNGVGIWDWNLLTQEMIWDDSMYALYRIRREDFSGTEEAWRTALHPDDLERGDKEVEAAIRGEKPFDTEFRVVWPNGEIRHIKAVAKVFRDERGTPLRMLGTNVDITDRKQAQHQMELLEHAVNASLDAVFLLDEDARIRYVNDAACRSLGYSREELLTMTPPDFNPDTTPEQMAKIMQATLANKLTTIETTHRSKDGRVFPVEISASKVEFGGAQLALAAVRDVSERKRLERELAEREELFRAIFEQAPNGVELIDMNTLRFVEANPAACRMLGYTHEEYLQLRLTDTQVDLDEEALIKSVQQLEVSGGATFENRHRCKNGDILDVEVTARPLDMPGKHLLVGIWRNITESKRAQAALRESETKYRELFETAGDGIFIQGADGFIDCNEKGASMYGLTRSEVIGRSPASLAPEKQPNGLSSADFAGEKILAALDGKPQQFEWQALRADGALLDVEITLSRIELGGIVCLQAVVRDISQRKRAEEQKENFLSLLDATLESSADAILVVDLDNRWVLHNQNFIDLWKITAEIISSGDDGIALTYVLNQLQDPDAFKNKVLELYATPEASSYDIFSFKDGKIVERYSIPQYIEGKVVGRVWSFRDITERTRAENALREREEIFSSIVNQAADSILLVDAETMGFAEFNRMAHESLGYTREEFAQLTLADVQAQYDREQLYRILHDAMVSGNSMLIETQHRRKDGSLRNTQVSSRAISIRGKSYFSSIWSDITERKRAEENLRITASVFDTSQEAILITDADNIITDVNPAFTHITGFSREEVLGHNPRLLSSGRHEKSFYAGMWKALKRDKAWRGEIWNRRKSGDVYAEMLSISAICDNDGKVQRHVGVFSDISHIKAHEAELSRVAHYDALTGIPNRVLLADRMRQAIAQTSREQNMVAVCYLDLDGFKPINDTLGHEAGDQVLIEVAKRLGDTIRGGDTVARLGGDEFVVLLLGLDKGEECVATLERLLAALAHPFIIKGNPISLGASIGVSIYPLDDEDPDTLLRHADQAMYVAKQSGKNRFYIYDAALDQRARNQHEFVRNIRHGLEQEQFELYFQPKINLRSRQLVGAEALIRWRHPELGLLVPAEFLRHIENTELDIKIGEWVIATALAHINGWQKAGLKIEISINISAYHLESAHFAEKLRQQLARYPDIPPGTLQIEVLETAALNDLVIVSKVVEACRAFGVSFALDDFGTGYSSLTYLSNLPVDVLKIDQSFVRGMLEGKGDRAIVQGIIALARAFGRQTVAEGIETDAHYQALLDMGCEVGQGYGIARPMPADKLTNWSAA